MMPALICVISVAAFLQFFVLHCRSILASSRKLVLSPRVHEVTGVEGATVAVSDFGRLLQLVKLCPERADDRLEIRAVGTYYNLLGALGSVARLAFASVASWTEIERRNCSYFAAVALDRRISHSRDLFTQQVAENL